MQESRKMRCILVFMLLTIGVVVFCILNVCIGSVKISLSDIGKAVTGKEISKTV